MWDEILVSDHTLIVSGLLIYFIWVSSHCGIPGNEIADRLTKVVFRFDPKINDVEIREIDAKLSYSEIKILIRQLSEKWNTFINLILLAVNTSCYIPTPNLATLSNPKKFLDFKQRHHAN